MTDAWLREAQTWQTLVAVRERLKRVAASSRAFGPLETLGSQLRSAVDRDQEGDHRETPGRLGRLANSSDLLRWLGRVRTAVVRAQRSGLVRRGLASGRAYVRRSFLYRWLTAEPEPDVIVIDLRETLTVGPWLRALERTIRWLLPAAVSSLLFRVGRWTASAIERRPLGVLGVALVGLAGLLGVAAGLTGRVSRPLAVAALVLAGGGGLLTRIDLSLAELSETRVYRALAAAFTLPEPPAPAEQSDAQPNGNSRRRTEGEDEATNDEPGEPDRSGEEHEQT